jgi:8-oxo-dGTP pyrophosphatase MutT (NUDIX family)
MTDEIEQQFQVGVKALIYRADGKLLLLSETTRAGTLWDLPGGRIQEGETFMEALSRELLEEIGITEIIRSSHFLTVRSNKNIRTATRTVGLVLIIYTVELPEGSALEAREEGIELHWENIDFAAKALSDKYPVEFTTALTTT